MFDSVLFKGTEWTEQNIEKIRNNSKEREDVENWMSRGTGGVAGGMERMYESMRANPYYYQLNMIYSLLDNGYTNEQILSYLQEKGAKITDWEIDLNMYIGFPGSGRTEQAKRDFDEFTNANKVLIQIDDYNTDGKSLKQIQKEMEEAAVSAIKNGKTVYYDAPNINSKDRKKLLDKITVELKDTHFHCSTKCVLVAKPYEKIVAMPDVNKEEVDDMHKKFQPPMPSEGWTEETQLVFPDEKDSHLSPLDFANSKDEYDQKNDHHTLTLGGHSKSLGNYLDANAAANMDKLFLQEVGYIHDCGKPTTRTFDENEKARYIGHANAGAYDALFYDYHSSKRGENEIPENENNLKLKASRLVYFHMDHYNYDNMPEDKKEKAINKFKEKVGNLYDEIKLIGEGDEYCSNHMVTKNEISFEDVICGRQFSAYQEKQILLGIEHGLSADQIKFYSNPEYDGIIMEKFRLGFEDGLSVEQESLCLNNFSDAQINMILDGFKIGLSMEQVEVYAKPEISYFDMYSIVRGFESGVTVEQMKQVLGIVNEKPSVSEKLDSMDHTPCTTTNNQNRDETVK